MKSFIRLEPKGKNETLDVFHENGVKMGEFLRGDDGYYDWWPEYPSRGGSLPAYFLRNLADELDRLNEPWNKQVEEDLQRLNASLN